VEWKISKLIPKGTASWMYVPFESPEHWQEINKWARKLGMNVHGGMKLMNPNTFEFDQSWYVDTEEDKTIFLLKWS